MCSKLRVDLEPELIRVSPRMGHGQDSHLADEMSSTVSFSFEAGEA